MGSLLSHFYVPPMMKKMTLKETFSYSVLLPRSWHHLLFPSSGLTWLSPLQSATVLHKEEVPKFRGNVSDLLYIPSGQESEHEFTDRFREPDEKAASVNSSLVLPTDRISQRIPKSVCLNCTYEGSMLLRNASIHLQDYTVP
jgi:hypothetical protein